MAAELSYRHTATGSTMKATIRKQLTTGGKIRMWRAGAVNDWEDLAVLSWSEYAIAMTETPASSYGYVGSWPATLTTVGWYIVDFYDGATIADTLAASFLGYWDGTNFHLDASNMKEVAGTTQTAGDIITAISAIGSGTGAALNFAPDDDNVDGAISGAPTFSPLAPFVGVQTSGTFASVAGDDGTYHQIDDDTNEIDIIYQFSVGAGRNCAKVVFTGYMGTSTSDTCVIKAYNFVTSTWDTRGTLVGQTGSTDKVQDITLLSAHTGTGTYAGKVYLRFDSTATNQVLYVDSVIAQAQNLGQTIGYADGSVWVDTVNGSAGTTPYVNGTADKPVLTWADAKTIATSVGVKSFRFLPGSSITLNSTAANMRFVGDATIALGSQSIANALFRDCYSITGVSSGDDASFYSCGIGTASFEHGYFIDCRFKGVMTMLAGSGTMDWYFINCTDASPSAGNTATFVNVANGQPMFRNWRGGIQINNHKDTNDTIIDGAGRLVIDVTSTAGNITIRGDFPPATGAATFTTLPNTGVITQTQRFGTDQILADTAGTTTLLTRTPNAVPGASGGLLIAGTNAPVTITGSGAALTLASTGANGAGLVVTGNGSGEGAIITGGATGEGIEIVGGATSGSGMKVWANGTNDIGLEIIGIGSGAGMSITGGATGNGIAALGGAVGHGLYCFGGLTSGDGIYAAGQTAGDGMTLVAAGALQYDLNADIKGDITGSVSGSVASVTTKTGYALASDGLDSISTTGPTNLATNFREMIVQVWRRFFKKATKTSAAIVTYADDGSTAVTTQAVTDDGTTETQGEGTTP